MNHYQTIIYEKKGYKGKIIFNRPEVLNALNNLMFLEIGNALENVKNDEEIRVLIITGKGKAFCAGADLKFSQEELKTIADQEAFFRLGNEMVVNRIENLEKTSYRGN